jgi:hypothetical protein
MVNTSLKQRTRMPQACRVNQQISAKVGRFSQSKARSSIDITPPNSKRWLRVWRWPKRIDSAYIPVEAAVVSWDDDRA